ncbi:MAG: class I SAM-dependent RNA methyltransferase [Syntrophales bacterium]
MKPLKKGDRVRITVDKVAFGGHGVGRLDNFVVFVPYAAEGDHLEIRIAETKKTYARGRIEKIATPSVQRTTPLCCYYGLCGGCHYQHIAYEHQLAIKQRQVAESFERIAGFRSAPVREIIPSGRRFGYRCKAEFHLNPARGSRPAIGFMSAGGTRVVDIERCEILEESINRVFSKFRKAFLDGWPVSENATRIFWAQPPSDLDDEVRTEDAETGFGIPEYVTRNVLGRVLKVPYRGFFQANTSLTGRLIETVLEMSGLKEGETVLDCYCGSGLFSMFMAGRAGRVYGIETDPEAVYCALTNFKNSGIFNASVFGGQVEDRVFQLTEKGIRPDIVLLDPPRTGCDSRALSGILDLAPRKIVYVSCDPATQARDVKFLTARGFKLDALQPVDMFPQTKHIEVIACLSRNGGPSL